MGKGRVGGWGSSNINEVIRPVLNFLFIFLEKDFTRTNEHKTAYSEQK